MYLKQQLLICSNKSIEIFAYFMHSKCIKNIKLIDIMYIFGMYFKSIYPNRFSISHKCTIHNLEINSTYILNIRMCISKMYSKFINLLNNYAFNFCKGNEDFSRRTVDIGMKLLKEIKRRKANGETELILVHNRIRKKNG